MRRSATLLLLAGLAVSAVGKALAAEAPRSRPTAVAGGHRVHSDAAADLELVVDPAYRALPPLRFPIESMTDAERRVFVWTGARRRISRMVVIQFERVQAGSDFRFVFPSTPPYRFGAQTYRSGAFVYDDARAAGDAPLREASRTRALLVAHGYRPPRLWRTARLARVSHPRGLGEVIIFYMENADGEFGPGPLPGADEDGDLPLTGEARQRLFDRLGAAVRVVRG